LIKFNDATNEFADKPLYNFDNSNFYLNNLFNEEPNFFNTAYNYEDEIALNLTIGDESLAINQADTSVLTDVILQKDILGVERNVGNSDIGAYQHITFPEEE